MSKRNIFVGIGLMIAATLACTWSPPAPPTSPTATPVTLDVSVYATIDWQPTGLKVHQGQIIEITYLSGTWAGRHGLGPAFPDIILDAAGGPPALYYPEFNLSANFGSLIARIDEGQAFAVGKHLIFTAPSAGMLQLRIHDSGLNDNNGSIQVRIKELCE